jgi:hypothetical protein
MNEKAKMIADELEEIGAVGDDIGDDARSLREHESLVRTRLGGDYDPAAWDDAMEILRERCTARSPHE